MKWCFKENIQIVGANAPFRRGDHSNEDVALSWISRDMTWYQILYMFCSVVWRWPLFKMSMIPGNILPVSKYMQAHRCTVCILWTITRPSTSHRLLKEKTGIRILLKEKILRKHNKTMLLHKILIQFYKLMQNFNKAFDFTNLNCTKI